MSLLAKLSAAKLCAMLCVAFVVTGLPTSASAKDGEWCRNYENCVRNFGGPVISLPYCWTFAVGCVDNDKRACKQDCRALKREAKAACNALSGKEKRACNRQRRELIRACRRSCKQ